MIPCTLSKNSSLCTVRADRGESPPLATSILLEWEAASRAAGTQGPAGQPGDRLADAL
jgi:hypothetical protein